MPRCRRRSLCWSCQAWFGEDRDAQNWGRVVDDQAATDEILSELLIKASQSEVLQLQQAADNALRAITTKE